MLKVKLFMSNGGKNKKDSHSGENEYKFNKQLTNMLYFTFFLLNFQAGTWTLNSM